MPQQNSELLPTTTACSNDVLAAETVFAKIETLRQCIVDAWHERGVTFTPEEQRQLKEEIDATASLFHDLTLNA